MDCRLRPSTITLLKVEGPSANSLLQADGPSTNNALLYIYQKKSKIAAVPSKFSACLNIFSTHILYQQYFKGPLSVIQASCMIKDQFACLSCPVLPPVLYYTILYQCACPAPCTILYYTILYQGACPVPCTILYYIRVPVLRPVLGSTSVCSLALVS